MNEFTYIHPKLSDVVHVVTFNMERGVMHVLKAKPKYEAKSTYVFPSQEAMQCIECLLLGGWERVHEEATEESA